MQLGLCVSDCQIKSLQREPMAEIEHLESYFLVRSQSDRFAGLALGLYSPTRCPVLSWCNPFQPQIIRVPHVCVCGLRINIVISHNVSVFVLF